MGSLLMHAFISITYAFIFFSLICCVFFLFSLLLPCSTSTSPYDDNTPFYDDSYCSQLPPFILFVVWDLLFLPLNCFWPLMGVFPRLPTSLPVT